MHAEHTDSGPVALGPEHRAKPEHLAHSALNLLIIEDSDDDAELVLRELRNAGFDVRHVVVDNATDLERALKTGQWDMIISDYTLPGFSGLDALRVVQKCALDIPFIIVSGVIGEDLAVSAMKTGAHDYVVKTKLARLVPAIERELREAEVRRQRRWAEDALKESESRFRGITQNLPGMVFQLRCSLQRRELSFSYVGEGATSLFGYPPGTFVTDARVFLDLIVPEDRISFERSLRISAAELSSWNWDGRVRIGLDNEIKWINLRSTPRKLAGGLMQWEGIMSNITQSKLAEQEIKGSRAQLAELSSHLQTIKEHERARIAREIHDDIGGLLVAIKIDVLWLLNRQPPDQPALLEKARSVERLVNRAIETTQRIARDLRPSILDLGLVAAIEWQSKDFKTRMGIPCHVSLTDEDIALEQDIAVALFRIFQECLTNISKHAQATEVRVGIMLVDGHVMLEVYDNGRGIAPKDQNKPGSFGLRGMQERARSFGGDVKIIGGWGQGTRVTVRIPCATPSNEDDSPEQHALF